MPKRRIPKYRHYKPKKLAVVRIEGKDHYLGRYDSAESWEKYHRLVAESFSNSPSPLPPRSENADLTVEHLIYIALSAHLESYFSEFPARSKRQPMVTDFQSLTGRDVMEGD